MTRGFVKGAIAALLVATGTSASGAAPEAGRGPNPDTTTASYGDWMVICMGSDATRRCEALHMVKDAKGQAVAALSVGRPGKNEPLRLSLRVGVNAWVAKPVALTLGAAAVPMPFRVCIAQGCIADISLDAGLMEKLLKPAAPSSDTVQWQDAEAHTLSFAISVRGLDAALTAMRSSTGQDGSVNNAK